MVQVARLTRHIGPKVQRPIVPSLLGAEGARCSVTPASHGALHSKSQEAYAFAQAPRLTLNLKRAG